MTNDRSDKALHAGQYFLQLNAARLQDARDAARAVLLINAAGLVAALPSGGHRAGVVLFALGATAAAVTSIAAYLANDASTTYRGRQAMRDELPSADDAGSPEGQRWRMLALAGACGSIAMFLAGAVYTAASLHA